MIWISLNSLTDLHFKSVRLVAHKFSRLVSQFYFPQPGWDIYDVLGWGDSGSVIMGTILAVFPLECNKSNGKPVGMGLEFMV